MEKGKASAGSFQSKEKIEEQIRRDRTEQAAKAAQNERLKEEAESEGEEKKEDSPTAIPKKVPCAVHGKEIPFEKFRKRYEDVFDQVKDKVHLSRGCVEFSASVGGGQRIKVKTLSSGEQKFVSHMSKATNSGFSKAVDQDEFYRWTLIFALIQYGTQNVSVAAPPRVFSSGPFQEKSEEDVEAYLGLGEIESDSKVREKLDLIDSLPQMVYNEITGIVVDVMQATSLAIQEDVVNP